MEAALENLYEQYYDKVVRYVFIRIGNQSEAEDLAGDVFLSALKSLRSYKGSIEQMRFWIFKIARNMVVDHYRKMSKRKTVNLDDVEISDNTDVEEMTEKRFKVAHHLLTEKEWDFFMMVEMGVDRIHHGFWKFHDPKHVKYEPGSKYEHAIRDYYIYVDRKVGELLTLVDSETAVLVVSDHGAKAMAGGVPVISCPVSGIPELVVEGRTGLLVPPGDAKRLADASERLLTDNDLRERCARGGRERIESEFDIRKSVDRVLKVFTRG